MDDYRHLKTTGVFIKALSVFVLYQLLTYVLHYDTLFGNSSIIYQSQQSAGWFKDWFFVLTHTNSTLLNTAFLILAAVAALLSLCKVFVRLSSIVLWYTVVNLHNYVYPTLTGGDYLLNQFLFFAMFLSTSNKQTHRPWVEQMKTVFHNFGFLAIQVQVCIAYFLAGYFKWQDDTWQQGLGVYYALNVHEFSLPSLLTMTKYSSLMVALNYFVLVYQLAFPVLVWVKPIKSYLLILGVLQHVFIAFGMGLFSFGLIMIVAYIPFLNLDIKNTY